jgi:hypothetical protein
MRKKYGRIAVFVLGCVLAVWGIIIYPILHRGTIIISITNQTDNAYTIVRINDQSVGELLEADGMIDVDYVITQSGPITAYFEDTSGQSMERLLTEQTNILCTLADDADSCVAYGCGKSLGWINHMPEGPINIARKRLMRE